jgi:hypothetical protein
MTDTTQEIATMDFNCPAAGKLVVIHSTYAIRVSRAGKRLGRQATETDCSNCTRPDCSGRSWPMPGTKSGRAPPRTRDAATRSCPAATGISGSASPWITRVGAVMRRSSGCGRRRPPRPRSGAPCPPGRQARAAPWPAGAAQAARLGRVGRAADHAQHAAGAPPPPRVACRRARQQRRAPQARLRQVARAGGGHHQRQALRTRCGCAPPGAGRSCRPSRRRRCAHAQAQRVQHAQRIGAMSAMR